MPLLSLAVVLIVTGLLVFILFAVLLADALIHPPRMTDGKALYLYGRLSPSDLQLSFENIAFDVEETAAGSTTIKIAGWWMPAKSLSSNFHSTRCVVLLHGFADGKVGSIAWAPLWLSLGFNVLAIDLRAHGESGGSKCTGGRGESMDVACIVRQLKERMPGECGEIFLFGISIGAAVALKAARECSQIRGVIMESPYADFVNVARATAERRGMPSGWCFTLATKIAQWRIGMNYAAVRPTALLNAVTCPVLWLHGDADQIVGEADRALIQNAITARGNSSDRVVSVAGADHLLQPGNLQEIAVAALREFTDDLR